MNLQCEWALPNHDDGGVRITNFVADVMDNDAHKQPYIYMASHTQ